MASATGDHLIDSFGSRGLRAVFEHAAVGMAVRGLDGEWLAVNSKLCEMFGYSERELLSLTSVELTPEDERGLAVDYNERMKRGEIKAYSRLKRYRRKDGGVLPVILSVSVVDDLNGQPSHLISVIQDVSEQVRLQNELERARDELERRVQERTAELREARDTAEAASKAKDRFIAKMSHEFRTPLNAVLGMADLLAEERLAQPQAGYVASISSSANYLHSIVNSILDFSRLEVVDEVPNALPFSLRGAIADVMGIGQGLVVSHDQVALGSTVAPGVPDGVVGDAAWLKQILVNLLGNAVKFTVRGGISLDVSRGGGGGLDAGSVRLRFAVSDSGPGIPAEVQERIFEPFEQSAPSTRPSHGGSGLGLSISRRLARRMGGDLRVFSEPGVGSTFILELDLGVAPACREEGSTIVESPVAAAAFRVLVVEDTQASRELMRAYLEKLGHKVDVAIDGAEAVRKVAGEPFDFVFMDVQMPVMDGLEAAAAIRGLVQGGVIPLPGPRIVGVSAFSQPADYERAMAAGMHAYLCKPVKLTELRNAFRTA